MELDKSNPVYTPLLTELMKLKSKEEEEKLHLQEEEWKEAIRKAQELWAKKRKKNFMLKWKKKKRHAEQVRLEKFKWEKCYDAYKKKLKEVL